MEGRTVGSGATLALDSDPSRSTLALASLTAAVAGPRPDQPGAGAGLAYAPAPPSALRDGGLFVLSECLAPAISGASEAARTAEYLAEAFWRSLCHDRGRALASAVQASGEWLRQRAWGGGALVQCALVAVVVADGQAWAMTTGGMAVYRLAAAGAWARLTPGAPRRVAPGDVLMLLSPGLLARVPAATIGSELQALVAVIPTRPASALAEWAVNLAGTGAAPGTSLALAVRIGTTPARPLAVGFPVTFPWHFPSDTEPALPAAGGTASRPISSNQLPPQGAAAGERSCHPERSEGSCLPRHALPAGDARLSAPLRSIEDCRDKILHCVQDDRHALLPGRSWWAALAGYRPLATAGLAPPLTLGWSLVELLHYTTGWPGRRGSAATAKARLQGQDGGALTPTKSELHLPPAAGMGVGCLDIASVQNAEGRIVAQVVLICPDHLLHSDGTTGGVYLLLHDLASGARRAVACLAPGLIPDDTFHADLATYGSGLPIYRLRGTPAFDLGVGRVRVDLRLADYRFADPIRRRQIQALTVTLTGVRGVR